MVFNQNPLRFNLCWDEKWDPAELSADQSMDLMAFSVTEKKAGQFTATVEEVAVPEGYQVFADTSDAASHDLDQYPYARSNRYSSD